MKYGFDPYLENDDLDTMDDPDGQLDGGGIDTKEYWFIKGYAKAA